MWYSHFAELVNDVFLLRWQADRLSFHHPGTFYNGFFPIGYPLLIRLVSFTGDPIFTMILAQVALAAVYAFLLYRFIGRVVPEKSIWIALPFALFAPPLLHAIPSAAPDFLSAVLVLLGLVILLSDNRWNYLLGFACLGLGYLFRVHVLVFAITLGFALIFYYKDSSLRIAMGFCAGVLPFVLLQGFVQLWSGHRFFENAQAFNIWKTMYGIDWSNPPALSHATALGIVVHDPIRFIAASGTWMVHYFFYFVPILVVIVFRRRLLPRRELQMLAVAALVYLILVSGGGSISAFTPILPIAAACVVPCFNLLVSRFRPGSQQVAGTIVAIGLWTVSMIGYGIFSQHERERIEEYSSVERTVLSEMGMIDPHRLFTDDYDLYFPGTPYRRPKTSGSWGEVGLPNYTKEFPHICDTSARAEYRDLAASGIELALFRIPPYDPRGYENVRNDTLDFHRVARTDSHEIYRIDGAGLR